MGAVRKGCKVYTAMTATQTSHFERIQTAAKFYLRCGYSVIRLGNDKRPLGPWTAAQDVLISEEDVDNWKECSAIGIVTGTVSGLAVIDCDSMDDATWWWKQSGVETTWTVRTKRGAHFYYRIDDGLIVKNGQKVNGRYDVRGEGGYVVAAPSIIEGHEYKLVLKGCQREKLGYFDSKWRAAVEPKVRVDQPKRITNGASYIRRIHATQGEGGDKATFRVACVLRDSGMSESEALLSIMEWNQTNAHPPWDVRDLQYKIECAFMKGAV